MKRLLTAIALAAACVAQAAPATPMADDAALEVRVDQLAAQLRCLVCQNQSLADSHAPLAVDLKNQVREQLRAGRSEAQVIEYLTQRYGDFVLYKPPLRGSTALLWAGPALLLGLGAALGWRALAARRSDPAGTDPNPALDTAEAQVPADWR